MHTLKRFTQLFIAVVVCLMLWGATTAAHAATIKPTVKGAIPNVDQCDNNNYSLWQDLNLPSSHTYRSSDGYQLTVSLYQSNSTTDCVSWYYTRVTGTKPAGPGAMLCAGMSPEHNHVAERCGYFTGNYGAENSHPWYGGGSSNWLCGYGDWQGHVGGTIDYLSGTCGF